MEFIQQLTNMRRAVSRKLRPLPGPHPAITLFFSVSDGPARAEIVHASGTSLESAWQKGLAQLRATMTSKGLQGRWLRVDWVDGVETMSCGELKTQLTKFKRNYFRLGLAFDPAFETAFLEQELNANAMLYGGNRIEHAVLNENNFRIYARRKFGPKQHLDLSDDAQVYVLSTAGVFCDEHGVTSELNGPGLNAGRRSIERISLDEINSLIETSSDFLGRQVDQKGVFIYGYHPCFDRKIDAYNTLRHASTTYSMIEAWEVTGNAALKDSIDRSLAYLRGDCIKSVTLPDGTQAAFVVDVGNEIKLGANAVAILAMTKYASLTGSTDDHALLENLALGIVHMQNAEDGSFVHVLHYPSLEVKNAFRTIYYEGEAAFGLMRLYNLTRDSRWLETVEKGFDHFIAQEHWKHHDHWLSYCVNELTQHRPEERYFRFGIQNIAGYLDFVLQRVTTFPTLLELMMAGRDMLDRIADMPQFQHLLAEIDMEKFHRALEYRAHYLLNGYFWPEMAMYFANPDCIVGSFFIRHHAFRVRIDDVEHYLSGFIAYLKYRKHAPQPDLSDKAPIYPPEQLIPSSGMAAWTAEQVRQATGGSWLVEPDSDWTATGISIYAPAMKPGNLMIVRSGEAGSIGVLSAILSRLPHPASGLIISEESEASAAFDGPVLKVSDTGEAILALGKFARDNMSGKILAVTGSAGKTSTVAMLTHALKPWGAVSQTAFNANLPNGVAWNLASMPFDVPHVVMELAIGRMGQSSALARPQVAIFTNIVPAHLGESSTIADIARAKSAIFRGMAAGDVAILNRDMLEWETVHRAAQARGLNILHYGTTEESAFQLVTYDWQDKLVKARIRGEMIEYRLGAAGEHMALNSLAVLAAAHAIGYALEPMLEQFANFNPLPGRGEELDLTLDGRRFTLIDDAYNANPGSMPAALEQLSHTQPKGRRVAVLAEMRDLGLEAQTHHDALATLAYLGKIDCFHVMGELYSGFWESLPEGQRGSFTLSLEELGEKVLGDIADGDTILFKGSNGTLLHKLVETIKTYARPAKADLTAAEISVSPAEITAKPWEFPTHLGLCFYDDELKQILYSQGSDRQFAPAAMVKLLSLSLIEEKRATLGLDTDHLIAISEKAARGSMLPGFTAGAQVEISSLMRAAAIIGSNEATKALAEWHSGSEEKFVETLNKRAATLGLANSNFTSSTGAGANELTSLDDMLLLARNIFACQPNVAAICAEKELDWNGRSHPNTNRLLGEFEGADGLRTGSLAGRIHHVIFSAKRGEHRKIALVFGAATRDERDQAVRDLFAAFDSL